ncbi:MAG: hypothetical protein LBS74_01040 [Oscillospiraceae bacterium]|jgi:hypothetical protein|nr:hypothetical protein [Oscillospiraceae bacterium]
MKQLINKIKTFRPTAQAAVIAATSLVVVGFVLVMLTVFEASNLFIKNEPIRLSTSGALPSVESTYASEAEPDEAISSTAPAPSMPDVPPPPAGTLVMPPPQGGAMLYPVYYFGSSPDYPSNKTVGFMNEKAEQLIQPYYENFVYWKNENGKIKYVIAWSDTQVVVYDLKGSKVFSCEGTYSMSEGDSKVYNGFTYLTVFSFDPIQDANSARASYSAITYNFITGESLFEFPCDSVLPLDKHTFVLSRNEWDSYNKEANSFATVKEQETWLYDSDTKQTVKLLYSVGEFEFNSKATSVTCIPIKPEDDEIIYSDDYLPLPAEIEYMDRNGNKLSPTQVYRGVLPSDSFDASPCQGLTTNWAVETEPSQYSFENIYIWVEAEGWCGYKDTLGNWLYRHKSYY